MSDLNTVLRAELTAVNQQFIHVLALRRWGLGETAERIMAVDRVDFPVAMKIIDHMVRARTPVRLAPEAFEPGACEASVLAAEQRVERRLRTVLDETKLVDASAKALVAEAAAPRTAYAEWLADRLECLAPGVRPNVPLADGIAAVFACIIAMLEQSMVHAFVHWHHGRAASADAAWAASGAAMMQATDIVHRLAERRTTPGPGGYPEMRISLDPAEAVAFDRALAVELGERARKAAERGPSDAVEICAPLADYAQELSAWTPGSAHPAAVTNPAAFGSFESTLDKFVRPQ